MRERAGVVAPGGEECDSLEERARAAHAAHAVHRSSAEVANPDRHREPRGHRHRPVVGEVPAGPGLGRGPERQVQRGDGSEARDSGDGIGQDVEHQRRRRGRDHHARLPRPVAGRRRGPPDGMPDAPVGQGPIGVGQFQQGDLAVAEGQAQAVVVGAAGERGKARPVQGGQERRHPQSGRQLHRGHVEGAA